MALSGKGKWILQMNRGWVGIEQVDQVKGMGRKKEYSWNCGHLKGCCGNLVQWKHLRIYEVEHREDSQ